MAGGHLEGCFNHRSHPKWWGWLVRPRALHHQKREATDAQEPVTAVTDAQKVAQFGKGHCLG